MTNQTAQEIACDESWENLKYLNRRGEWVADPSDMFNAGWQATQADQASTITQLQLNNAKLREALSRIDLRKIAKKVINDSTNRYINQQSMYVSEDLMISLVKQAIDEALGD